jgi:hypothetical protein
MDQSAWIHLGEFKSLDQAIAKCKKVIDGYLNQYRHSTPSPEELVENYLMYGPVPCINGVENLKSFDPYEYLNTKCAEISTKHQAITSPTRH